MQQLINYLKSLGFIQKFSWEKMFAEAKASSVENTADPIPRFSPIFDWTLAQWAENAKNKCDEYIADTDSHLVAELISRCFEHDSKDLEKYILEIKTELRSGELKFSFGRQPKSYELLEV